MATPQQSDMVSRRAVRTLIASASLAAASLVLIVTSFSTAHAAPQQSPTRPQVIVTLTRLGCEPEALAAAGLTAADIAPLVESVRSALTQDPERLIRADASVATMRRLVEAAHKRPESDPARSAQLADAQSDLVQSIAARDLALSTLRDAAFAQVSPDVTARHARIVRNRAWNLPTRYLVKDRAEAEWVALRDALARIHSRSNPESEIAPTIRAMIDAEDRDPEVLAAAQRLRPEHFDGFRTAWTAALQTVPITP